MRHSELNRKERAAEWAIRMSSSSMPDEQHEEFQAWLDADPANVQTLSEVVGAWQAVESYAAAAPMMELREEALASARRSMRQREASQARRRPAPLMLLAASLLMLILGAGIWFMMQPTTYETGLGERRIVALDDGSKLSLDAETVVRVRYSGDQRQLWLDQGRAKFSVAKDPLRPFSVAAAGRLVVATGTEFSVELIDRQLRVILYEGHVAVMKDGEKQQLTNAFNPKADAPKPFRMLDPGKELVLAQPDIVARPVPAAQIRTPVDLERSASWESGLLVFENEALRVVAERTNRYADRPLELADDKVGSMRISGVFRAGDTEGLVDGLSATIGVQSERRGEAIMLKAPAGGE